MNNTDILKKTDSVINNKWITISVDIRKQNWLDKLLEKSAVKEFRVIRASLGTLINFSSKTLDLTAQDKVDFASIIKSICANGKLLAECIAILIEDTQYEPTEDFVDFLLTNIDAEDSKAILATLIEHSKVEDFMSSTILITGMSLLKTEELIAFEQITGKQ